MAPERWRVGWLLPKPWSTQEEANRMGAAPEMVGNQIISECNAIQGASPLEGRPLGTVTWGAHGGMPKLFPSDSPMKLSVLAVP